MSENNPWLSYVRPNPHARLRLFCCHYAGGSAALFRTWQGVLPQAVEVCPVQLPGRENRIAETSLTRLPDIAARAATALRPMLDRPYAIFGHSMGALLGFELARQWRQAGAKSPAHVFVSGCRAPHTRGHLPSTRQLPDEEFLAEVRSLNGTPAAIFEHPELLQLLLPVLRADFAAVQTYEYVAGPPLDCPMTALGGLADAQVSRAQLADWQAQTTRDFAVRMLPGDHFFLNTAQPLLLEMIGQQLRGMLAERRDIDV